MFRIESPPLPFVPPITMLLLVFCSVRDQETKFTWPPLVMRRAGIVPLLAKVIDPAL
jgi:hypothetical protein